jgi:hypothetical protein
MMFTNDLYLTSFCLFFFHLIFTEATQMISNKTIIHSTSTINMTLHGNITTILTTKKTLFIQGKELIHESLHKMNRNIVVWSIIALATLTCLILMYVGMKTFL